MLRWGRGSNLEESWEYWIVWFFSPWFWCLEKRKEKADVVWLANADPHVLSPPPSSFPLTHSLIVHVWPSVFLLHLSCSVPSDLQGTTQHQGCPGGRRDLDREGSDWHHHQPCADAVWILQVPAAYQAACRRGPPHLVCAISGCYGSSGSALIFISLWYQLGYRSGSSDVYKVAVEPFLCSER